MTDNCEIGITVEDIKVLLNHPANKSQGSHKFEGRSTVLNVEMRHPTKKLILTATLGGEPLPNREDCIEKVAHGIWELLANARGPRVAVEAAAIATAEPKAAIKIPQRLRGLHRGAIGRFTIDPKGPMPAGGHQNCLVLCPMPGRDNQWVLWAPDGDSDDLLGGVFVREITQKTHFVPADAQKAAEVKLQYLMEGHDHAFIASLIDPEKLEAAWRT
ncbi:hypothetical protein AVP3_0058 [Aeromonas phage AVP3]